MAEYSTRSRAGLFKSGQVDTSDIKAGAVTLAKVAQDVTDYVDNSVSTGLTGYATETYVGTAISNLIDGAPVGLDTLNELAAAIGDDPDFVTTVTTSIGTKLASADFNSTFDTRLGTKSTSNLAEGTNLYYTNARVDSEIDSYVTGGTGVTVTSGEISIGQDVGTNANVNFNDLTLSGNLTVNGTTTTVNTANLSVTDNMIYLADGNTTTNIDIGFAGNYNDGTYAHAGLFRDASDGRWKFFDSYIPEPDAAVDINTSHASFNLAPLQAGEFIGDLTGNVTGTVSSLSNHSTSNLTEGTNLYYTDTRVGTYLTSNSYVTQSGTQTLTNKTIAAGSNTISGLTNSNLSGSAGITNANLANSSVTVNGTSISLGGSATITATNTNALTIGTGLSGTSYNGSSAVTIAIDSTVATLSGTQTLTNKTINLTNNTLSGTVAQFNAAVSDDDFATVTQLNTKQATLVSGTNIKTINGTSVLGSGDITISGAADIAETVKTISSNYTITSTKNGMSVGPVTVASGVTVTVPSGSRWVVI